MFVQSVMRKVVEITPEQFALTPNEAITNELNRSFSNKVVLDVGLCIVLWEIIDKKELYILPCIGSIYVMVTFSFVVFRPFIGQVLTGKVRSCDPEGINVSMGFFDDIKIPKHAMPHPSRFDENDQVWLWEYASDADESFKFYTDVNETIRFKVTGELFREIHNPTDPEMLKIPKEERIPYLITGSINEDGLGVARWW